jgi:hypothetical protein
LALLGRALLKGVIAQQAPGYPNMGQINLYVVWPLFVFAALLAGAWFCNSLRRWPALLGAASGVSILAIPLYLMFWGGGV